MSSVNSEARERIQSIINALSNGFMWDSSKKGHFYWENVRNELELERDRIGGVDPNDI